MKRGKNCGETIINADEMAQLDGYACNLIKYAVLAGIDEAKARRGVLQGVHEDHERRSLHSSLFRGLPSWHLYRA